MTASVYSAAARRCVWRLLSVVATLQRCAVLLGQASSATLLPARLSLSERAGKVIPARSADKLSALLRQMRLRHHGEG
jgi:hypothetical protein